MADVVSKAQRSRMMASIRTRDTEPERAVRSIIHALGYRFRLNRKDLPGSPDIVLPRYKTVIFVHGCFWHRHRGCKYAYHPGSNQAFWNLKFKKNVARDKAVTSSLRALGWRVMVVWECELRSGGKLVRRLSQQIRTAE